MPFKNLSDVRFVGNSKVAGGIDMSLMRKRSEEGAPVQEPPTEEPDKEDPPTRGPGIEEPPQEDDPRVSRVDLTAFQSILSRFLRLGSSRM
jgi:hypothetical protein